MISAEYIDHVGDDLKVVNAAKVSFDKQSEWIFKQIGTSMEISKVLSEGDKRLIKFLARGCSQQEWDDIKNSIIRKVLNYENHKNIEQIMNELETILNYIKTMPTHFSPFCHSYITLRETVPIAIARQRFKHQIGFSYNEVSRRYVDNTPEFYVPEIWRGRSQSKKQGSDYNKEISYVEYREKDGELIGHFDINVEYDDLTNHSLELYTQMINSGVAPEQARLVLPQSMLTSYYVSGTLYAFARAYNQRHDRNHAQGEIADLADNWNKIIMPLFPVAWSALTNQ